MITGTVLAMLIAALAVTTWTQFRVAHQRRLAMQALMEAMAARDEAEMQRQNAEAQRRVSELRVNETPELHKQAEPSGTSTHKP